MSGTALDVSRLSFGTASLHHLPTSSGRQKLLAAALDSGFTHFDTAPLYGFGIAEQEVGRALSSFAGEITVASKIGLYPPGPTARNTFGVWSRKALGKLVPGLSKAVVDWSLARASKSLDRSLQSMKRDCLDILFLHAPQASMINEEKVQSWLLKQRELGKIRYWGVAGELDSFKTWLSDGSQLCQIIQTRDSLAAFSQLDRLDQAFPALITYGAISSARHEGTQLTVTQLLSEALHRNPNGSVLVSSNNISHVKNLAEIVEQSS